VRTDDPVILARIREIERACEGLRMACGFPPLVELPETTASRKPKWCPHCPTHGFTSTADLEHHLATEHSAAA